MVKQLTNIFTGKHANSICNIVYISSSSSNKFYKIHTVYPFGRWNLHYFHNYTSPWRHSTQSASKNYKCPDHFYIVEFTIK